jgi:hypothetical protein
VQIPGFKKIAESQPSSPAIKPLPSLVMVSVACSSSLIHFYWLFYFCFMVSVLVVISSLLAGQPWFLIAIAFVVVGAVVMCRQQITKIFAGKLWVEQGVWQLRGNNVAGSYTLAGEVCCWPFIVLLPLQHQQTGKLIYLALARDSLSPADNARLRTWLRVCLRPKT